MLVLNDSPKHSEIQRVAHIMMEDAFCHVVLRMYYLMDEARGG